MNMNNINWKILAILGIGGIVLTGVGTFAATSTATQSEVLNTRRPQMMKEFWTWNLKELKNSHVQMNNLLTNLSEENQKTVETLLTELREWEKQFFENLKAATTETEKTALQEKWETSKTSLKEKLLNIVWEENKESVEKMFSRTEKNWKGMGFERNGKQWNVIINRFINEDTLSETDKTEIKAIEEKKEESIKSLQEKNQEAMKEINNEYFSSIKKFVAEDKQEEFESFVEKADEFGPMNKWFWMWKWRMWGMRWNRGEAPEAMNGERPEFQQNWNQWQEMMR